MTEKEKYVSNLKKLLKEEDDKHIQDKNNIFGYVPIEYPENFFDIYFETGMSIEDALDELTTPSY